MQLSPMMLVATLLLMICNSASVSLGEARSDLAPAPASPTPADPTEISTNTMIALVNDTLKPFVKSEHDFAQRTINNLIAAFSGCGKDNEISAFNATTRSMNTEKSSHETCRQEQRDLDTIDGTCTSQLDALHSKKTAAAGLLETLTKNPAAEADRCHPSPSGTPSYINWVEDNLVYFDDAVKKWEDAYALSTNATEEHNSKETECQGTTSDVGLKKSLCDANQTNFERAVCAVDTARSTLCEQSCFDSAVTQYNLALPDIQSGEAARKITWRVLMRMECLLSILSDGAGSGEDIEGCRGLTHNTTHLNLNYPILPGPGPCPDPFPIPCTEAFSNQYYAALPVEVGECEPCMGVANPADWVVVLKVGHDPTLGFTSPLWENDVLLNSDSPVSSPGNAKYNSYLTKSFTSIRMCVGSPDSNCVQHTFTSEWASAKDLFSAGFIRATSLDQTALLSAFGPAVGSYQDCGMTMPGFNVECLENNKARFGYCNNCVEQPCATADSDDQDGAIGIGLMGQGTDTQMGGGWTAYFASGDGTCSPSGKTYKNVWLSVK